MASKCGCLKEGADFYISKGRPKEATFSLHALYRKGIAANR